MANEVVEAIRSVRRPGAPYFENDAALARVEENAGHVRGRLISGSSGFSKTSVRSARDACESEVTPRQARGSDI